MTEAANHIQSSSDSGGFFTTLVFEWGLHCGVMAAVLVSIWSMVGFCHTPSWQAGQRPQVARKYVWRVPMCTIAVCAPVLST